MRKVTLCFSLSILLIAMLNCQEYSFDPWGVWNSYPVDITTDRIITFDGKQYYEAGNSGMYIVEDCKESFPFGDHFPAFAVYGDYNKIEKYEKIEYGFLFYMIGDGTRRGILSVSKIAFQEDTRIQIKMVFINPDECRFEYISKVDENGFRLSFLPDEGVTYRRYRADDSEPIDPAQ